MYVCRSQKSEVGSQKSEVGSPEVIEVIEVIEVGQQKDLRRTHKDLRRTSEVGQCKWVS